MIENWTENDLLVNGAKFHYHRSNAAGQPVLLLVHGFSDNGMCWIRAARAWENEYDIILPDLRGHGQSQRLQPGEQADNAADLDAFLGALELEQVVVGGHSMGAVAAADLGALYPHRVSALVLEDPSWRAEETQAAPGPNPFWDWLKSLSGATVDEVIAHGRANNSPLWGEEEWIPWAEAKLEMDKNILKVPRLVRPWREIVARLRAPTLLVTADVEKGAIVTQEVAYEAAELNPLVEIAPIPDAGHSIRRENFDAYIDAVNGFLKTVAK